MNEYIILKERENSLSLDKDLIEIQKTVIYYGKKIEEVLNKVNKILENDQSNKQPLKIIDDKQKTGALLDHLRRIK